MAPTYGFEPQTDRLTADSSTAELSGQRVISYHSRYLNNNTKLALIESFDKVLSLDLIKEEKTIDEDLEKYIKEMIEKRKEAKLNKDYTLADSIRKELEEKGIILKDTREGTLYEVNK